MRKLLIAFMCLGCAIARSALGADTEELAVTVRKLVRQLDSMTVKERDEARNQLIELGPEILPMIEPILDDSQRPEGVRNYLKQVRIQLQTAQAAANAVAKSVTLQGDAVPLSEVCAAFTAQTGNKIVDQRKKFGATDDDIKIKCDFEKTPFWTALDQVLDRANLNIYPYAGQEGLALVPRPQGGPPRFGHATYDGPFRIEATKISAERDLRDANSSALRIWFEVAWEPRLAPISIEQSFGKLQAVDDQGRPLTVTAGGEGRNILVTPRATAVALDAPLSLPGRSAKKIASLKGSLAVKLLGPVQEFRFSNLNGAKNVAKSTGPLKVTLQEIRKNNDLWQVGVMVSLAEGKGVESHTNWVARNEAVLLRPDGKPVESAGMELFGGNGQNEIGANYLFDGPEKLDGCIFVYKSPIPVPDAVIQFDLKDVELP